MAQLARAPALQAGGHRFESDYLHHKAQDIVLFLLSQHNFLIKKMRIGKNLLKKLCQKLCQNLGINLYKDLICLFLLLLGHKLCKYHWLKLCLNVP